MRIYFPKNKKLRERERKGWEDREGHSVALLSMNEVRQPAIGWTLGTNVYFFSSFTSSDSK